jgi:hypothetical protein
VVTDEGTVTARHVVMATHLPLGQIGMYYSMAYPHAEPVIAAPIGFVPPGMYKNAEKPGRSIRTHRSGGQTWGIVAGTSFKPGHPDDEQESIRDVEAGSRIFRRRPGRISLGQRGLRPDGQRALYRLVVERRRRLSGRDRLRRLGHPTAPRRR